MTHELDPLYVGDILTELLFTARFLRLPPKYMHCITLFALNQFQIHPPFVSLQFY